ncbi:sulfatase-like hydrolase/transferase, partial [bacterium]|nr:sulfatase-like hydrolase/transferase [bacterium]
MPDLNRRSFLALSGAALAARPSLGADERPLNLLFLMTDQHHHRVLGCAGNPMVKTPHLDRLAAQGVRFTHAACPVPFCSPTRASLLTGRYPSTMGLWRNIKANKDPLALREPMHTYLHELASRGYQCHQLGKWHLGNQADLKCFVDGQKDVDGPKRLLVERRRAAGQGVRDAGPRKGEELVGDVFMTKATAKAHAIWKDEKRRSPQDLSIIGRSRTKPEFHYESVLADYCVELLRRHRDEPFAITWSVSPPHALWVAPAPFYDLYDPAKIELPANWKDDLKQWSPTQAYRLAKLFGEAGVREYMRCYYAQVSMMDWCVGRILDELDRLGLADRTLVIFTSDHGDMLAGHGLMDKTVPTFFEEIVRVPLLMRLPGPIPKGGTSDVLNSSVDIPCTILDVLGGKPLKGAHGRSLLPFA